MITLVIKGRKFDACGAAEYRGIPFIVNSERSVVSHTRLETIGQCPDGFLSAVLCWFLERHPMVKGFGYPVGTLLWYRAPDALTELEEIAT